MSINISNPEFSEKNFIPNVNKEYIISETISLINGTNLVTVNTTKTGFKYIHALILGKRDKEFIEYSKNSSFKTECNEKLSNGFDALSLALLYPYFGLKTIYPFYTQNEIDTHIEMISKLLDNYIYSPDLYFATKYRQLFHIQNKQIDEMKNRLSDRETYKQALREGRLLEEAIVESYI
jgi:hypothetical protein